MTTASAEVKLLAETHGVSVDDALDIVNWMTAAEHAVVKVRKSFPATFAGSEFVHDSGAVHMTLWVTGGGRDELALLERTVPEASFATVSRRNAPLSELTMERTVSSLVVAETGDQTWGSLDFKTGRWFTSGSAARIHSLGGNDTAVCYRLDWARNALSGLYIYCGGPIALFELRHRGLLSKRAPM